MVVVDRESCNRLPCSIITEPLSDTLGCDRSDLFIVGDIVTLVPVLHLRRSECIDIFLVSDALDSSRRGEEFFLCTAGSITPFPSIPSIFEAGISRLLIVISEVKSSPSFWNLSLRIRDPGDHRMSESESFLEHFDIRLDISPLIFDNTEEISKKSLFPGILRRIPDIESGESAALEVFAIGVGTRSVVVEIPWIFGWSECNHRETIAENREKGKN